MGLSGVPICVNASPMAGQIIARGEPTWLVQVYVGRDSETGKRQYQSKTVHGKEESQRYLNEVLPDRDMALWWSPRRPVSDASSINGSRLL